MAGVFSSGAGLWDGRSACTVTCREMGVMSISKSVSLSVSSSVSVAVSPSVGAGVGRSAWSDVKEEIEETDPVGT